MNLSIYRRPRRLARACVLLSLLVQSQGCMTPDVDTLDDPDPALSQALSPMLWARDEEGHDHPPGKDADGSEADDRPPRASVAEERRELRRLALRYPRHAPTLTAAAALAVEDGDRIQAQYLLDQASNADPEFLPAALLRVRLAAEEGSLRLAKRRLEELLTVRPDEPRLHDALAGVLYLETSYEEARGEVILAQRLDGDAAVPGHYEYHLGLISEALDDQDAALGHYRASLESDPERADAAARIRWLEALQPEE